MSTDMTSVMQTRHAVSRTHFRPGCRLYVRFSRGFSFDDREFSYTFEQNVYEIKQAWSAVRESPIYTKHCTNVLTNHNDQEFVYKMNTTRDVDDAVIEQARSLLPYVRANGNPDTRVDCLSDVPWFLVMVFELLTTENIADELKPFGCLEDQAHTLQMILDTLEQTLRLPMNHITGRGLARLERRHLSDALQIFSDLVKHCYPGRQQQETESRAAIVLDPLESRALSLSQFESPQFEAIDFSKSCMPELSALYPNVKSMLLQEKNPENKVDPHKGLCRSSRNSPVVTVRPVPQVCPSQISTNVKGSQAKKYSEVDDLCRTGESKKNYASMQLTEREKSFQSSKSSTTLLKQVYRNKTTGNDANCGTDKQQKESAKRAKNAESPHLKSVFVRRLPSLTLLSPVTPKQKNRRLPSRNRPDGQDKDVASNDTRSHRYKPYEQPSKPYDLIEYPLTKKLENLPSQHRLASARATKNAPKPNQNSLKRPPSTSRAFCRKPSVKSFNSPAPVTARRTNNAPKRNLSRSFTPKINSATYKNISTVRERGTSFKSILGIKTNVHSNKGNHAPLSRSVKPPVVKLNSNPPKTGIVKKPPQPSAKKHLVKVAVSLSGQRTYSKFDNNRRGSVSCRRQEVGTEVKQREIRDGGHVDVYSPFVETDNSYSPIPHMHPAGNRRRPSVVSTKVRKHSLASPRSPVETFKRDSKFRRPVKRGEVSPQTTSLCSSLKLLEEFDYVKRRLKEIQVQKREYMEAISELVKEEVRLEYLLTHVQRQSSRALHKGETERVTSLGTAV